MREACNAALYAILSAMNTPEKQGLLLASLHGDGIHDDTETIQSLLDLGLPAVLLPPARGGYLISRTLKISSNTALVLDPFTVIRLAEGSSCPLIENHGYCKGGDARIAIHGGIWDMDNTRQGPNPIQIMAASNGCDPGFRPDRYIGMAMRFESVKHLEISSVTVRNPVTYGIAFCNITGFTVKDIVFDYGTWNPIPLNMDGLHFDGGCRYGRISNLRGTCFDDLVALNANDGCCAPNEAPIHDIDMDGIYAGYCHSAIRILSAGAKVSNITVRNVHANCYCYTVGLTHYFPEKPRGCIENVTMDSVFTSKVFAPEGIDNAYRRDMNPIWIEGPVDVGTLDISNLVREERNLPAATVGIDPRATVNRLSLRFSKMDNLLGRPVRFIDGRDRVDNLILEKNIFGGEWV